MTAFWILAASMTALAMGFVLVPLLRTRAPEGPSTAEANLEVLRSQRRELDADVANGTLPAAARDEALAELQERAAEDVQHREPTDATPRKPWIVAGIAAIAIPLLAFALYLRLGQPGAVDPALLAAMKAPADDRQVVELVETLARKVRERPDDARGWTLLARSMAAIGRYQEAADAYAHLVTLVPRDAGILADYADTLGMAQGRSLAGRPYQLAKEALGIDPNHPKALALAGTAALDEGDFKSALAHWEHLSASLPAESTDRPQVQAVIAEVRQRAAQAGKLAVQGTAVASAPAASSRAPAASPSAAAERVSGSIAVAPEVASRIKGDETLFVYARAEGGSRMPLAIVRTSARALPMQFALDDSQAMAPTMKLSGARAVRIEARVSRSGNAQPQAGDVTGMSGVVQPGATGIHIVLDKVVP